MLTASNPAASRCGECSQETGVVKPCSEVIEICREGPQTTALTSSPILPLRLGQPPASARKQKHSLAILITSCHKQDPRRFAPTSLIATGDRRLGFQSIGLLVENE